MSDAETDGGDGEGESPDDVEDRRETVLRIGRLTVAALSFVGLLLWTVLRVVGIGTLAIASAVASPDRRAAARQWFLLRGNRQRVAGLIVAGAVALTLLLGLIGVVGVDRPTFVSSLFNALISGLFSFVPIVISVNQLTVSQLFETPTGLRERIDSVHDFRVAAAGEAATNGNAPTEPGPFLAVVCDAVSERAEDLRDGVPEEGAAAVAVSEYADRLLDRTALVEAELDGSNQRLISVLLPMMGQSYSDDANDARRLRAVHGDSLPMNVGDTLTELQELAVSLDVLRQYFKALYVQQELSTLSRLIAYTGVGAFLVGVFVLMAFADGTPPVTEPIVIGIVSISVGVATLPFAVLLSYVVRIATIAKRTSAPGTFTPRRESPSREDNL